MCSLCCFERGVKLQSCPKHLYGNDAKSKIEDAQGISMATEGNVMISTAGKLSAAEDANFSIVNHCPCIHSPCSLSHCLPSFAIVLFSASLFHSLITAVSLLLMYISLDLSSSLAAL